MLGIDKNATFLMKICHFGFKHVHFWLKKKIGQKCYFEQQKAPAAARRYNNKGFKQKKGACGSTEVQKQWFYLKNIHFQNMFEKCRFLF